MNKDQNLIFEAYTKSLVKENAEYDNDALMVNGDEYIVKAIVSGDDVEITTLFNYDKELDDHNEINLGSISPKLRQDIEDSIKNDLGEDNEEFSSEGEEDNNLSKIEASLEKIADELKTLNQYADFMTTGTRAQGFTGETKN